MMSFDRFTERAQEAAGRAFEVMQRYGHTQLDTEHILMALLEQSKGTVVQILEGLHVDADAMTDKLEKKSEDIDAVVAAMYNGKQYFLFVYKVFKDIHGVDYKIDAKDKQIIKEIRDKRWKRFHVYSIVTKS